MITKAMAGGSWPQTEILNQFGENLKKARTAKELSLRALADTADMDFGNIKRQSKPRSKMDYDKPGHYVSTASDLVKNNNSASVLAAANGFTLSSNNNR